MKKSTFGVCLVLAVLLCLAPTALASEPTFPDMAQHWGSEYADKAAALGLFIGGEDGNFHPDEEITRADFLTALWRGMGSPEPESESSFSDVPADAYYAKAAAWACGKGYVSGTERGLFLPFEVIERQAAMKILFYCVGEGSGTEMILFGVYDNGFADSGEIAPWAKDAMYWAYYGGVISGTDDGRLAPTGGTTRAQAAKMLVRCFEKNLQEAAK